MKTAEIIVGILAVWRLTHLLQAEDGPWELSYRLRRAAGQGFWAKLLDCFYCLSLWAAAPAAWLLGGDWRARILLWLGLSGGAILLERATARTISFVEDSEEESNVVLRKDASTTDADNLRASA